MHKSHTSYPKLTPVTPKSHQRAAQTSQTDTEHKEKAISTYILGKTHFKFECPHTITTRPNREKGKERRTFTNNNLCWVRQLYPLTIFS